MSGSLRAHRYYLHDFLNLTLWAGLVKCMQVYWSDCYWATPDCPTACQLPNLSAFLLQLPHFHWQPCFWSLSTNSYAACVRCPVSYYDGIKRTFSSISNWFGWDIICLLILKFKVLISLLSVWACFEVNTRTIAWRLSFVSPVKLGWWKTARLLDLAYG